MKPFWKKTPKKKLNPPSRSKKQLPEIKKHDAVTEPKARPEPWTPPQRHEPPIPTTQKAQQIYRPQEAKRMFLKTFRELTYKRPPWEIWQDFVSMFACAISNAVDKNRYDEREQLYLKTIGKYDKREQKLFPELAAQTIMALEVNPEQDFLGSIFMELGLGSNDKAQFFTHYHVCQFMAAVTEGDLVAQVKEKGYITINDPCCGAGATLIASVNEAKHQLEKAELNFQNHILIAGQDIDWTSVMMCYIQISLLGVAGYFKVGNSLTEPMTDRDSTENYWVTPMYHISPIWNYRQIFQKMDTLIRGEHHES